MKWHTLLLPAGEDGPPALGQWKDHLTSHWFGFICGELLWGTLERLGGGEGYVLEEAGGAGRASAFLSTRSVLSVGHS